MFLRDRTLGTTELVSVSSAEVKGGGVGAAISADGLFVAFSSGSTLLVPGDTNGLVDVFVRDLVAGTTERVSVDSAEVQAMGGPIGSLLPAIDADGSIVAFQSFATNLVAGDTNGLVDVFVRDRALGTTERVSIDSAEAQAAGGNSQLPAVNDDGRFVAFASLATNLVSGDTNAGMDIFVRDRTLGTTVRVSVDSAEGQAMPSGGNFPGISANGKVRSFRVIRHQSRHRGH